MVENTPTRTLRDGNPCLFISVGSHPTGTRVLIRYPRRGYGLPTLPRGPFLPTPTPALCLWRFPTALLRRSCPVPTHRSVHLYPPGRGLESGWDATSAARLGCPARTVLWVVGALLRGSPVPTDPTRR